MQSHRPVLLMAVLFALTLGYILSSSFSGPGWHVPNPVPDALPLPGKNTVSGLTVTKPDGGLWTANFDYYYTGEPVNARLRIDLTPLPQSLGRQDDPRHWRTSVPPPTRGAHHVTATVGYPFSAQTTRYVEAKLTTYGTEDVLARQKIDKVIDWPTFDTYMRDQQVAENTPDTNLKRAVALINGGSEQQIGEAKRILERLLEQNSRFDQAYVEMARATMKTNWSPEGLHQAETLLGSALEINPNSANAKILLGYVYAHQKQFANAEVMFSQAAASNPPNLWLWTNWGEMLEMQGKPAQAAAKYREAINRPVAHDTYDPSSAGFRCCGARAQAYTHLLTFLERRHDLDGMETLYRQRISEFGPGSCSSSDYARFKLQVRGDAEGAIQIARAALNQNCNDAESRQMLGLGEYVKWTTAKDPERTEALHQARIYLPAGPMPLYLLACSEQTVAAAKALVASGEQIDQRDNEGLTALAHALRDGKLDAAKRLLALGARTDALIGPLRMPVALLPVIEENIPAIRLMRQHGVDYTSLRYRGTTAVDFAKQSGNSSLLQAVADIGSTL